MFSRKGKLKQSSAVNNGGDKHSNSALQLNGECMGDQTGDGHQHKLAETAIEQGAPLGKGEAKPSELPDLNAVAPPVGSLPSQCTNRKKIYKRKHFEVLLAESMVASVADEKKLDEVGEEGGSGVSGDEHPAAAATDGSLLQLTADALLPDGGIRSITTQFKKRGKQRKSIPFSLGGGGGGGAGHESVEEPPLKVEGRVSSTPRKRKGRPRKFNIGTLDDLSAGPSISESDDQPLSMLFGFHRPTPATVDDTRHSFPSDASQVDVVQKKNKANEPSNSSSSSSTGKAIIQWNGSSPFMKRSPIWKAIETMQIFHKFPQNPHFLPLLDRKEDCREGLAIGHMVNFANVAEKAFKLKITQDITTCLETLQDLEPHGFDVTAVRDHLNKMLSIKETQQKLREKKTRLENRILELTQEYSEIDQEIAEFNEKMKRLQEKLASAKSKQEEKLSEIVVLKGKSGSISQLIDGVEVEDTEEYYLKLATFFPHLG